MQVSHYESESRRVARAPTVPSPVMRYQFLRTARIRHRFTRPYWFV